MKYCAVINCINHVGSAGDIWHYRFPTNETLRKRWLVKCGRDESFDCEKFRVCSCHFSDEDFESDSRGKCSSNSFKRNLKSGAEPHLNLVFIKEEPLDTDELEVEEIETLPHLGLHNSQSSTTSCKILDNTNFVGESVSENYPAETGPLEPIENDSVVISVVQSSVSSSNVAYIPSSLPASQNWAGPYDFTVSFGPQEKNTKGVSWTFSKTKDKLYVGKDVPCPINFSANATMPDDVSIRAMALYSSPEHASEIVHRCVNHSMDELTKEIFEAQHLIRCESSMASYAIDQTTKRHSVIVPFENPPSGQLYSTYIYKFTCFGSCAGGPNRRPLMLIFSLEKGGRVVGRRKLDVKICACPGRDRKAEEIQLMPPEEVFHMPIKRKESDMNTSSLLDTFEFARSISLPPTKKNKHSHDHQSGTMTINAETKGCYDFLKQMKRFYNMCETVNKLPSGVRKALMHQKRHKNHIQDTDSN